MPEKNPYDALAKRIAHLSHERSVLVISARLPLQELRTQLGLANADLSHVFILDVVSDFLSAKIRDPEHEASIPNPAMLELITAKAAKIVNAKAEREATIVVDGVSSFLAYNEPQALQQIARHALSILKEQNDQEYAVNAKLPGHIWEMLQHALPEAIAIGPDGSLILPAATEVGIPERERIRVAPRARHASERPPPPPSRGFRASSGHGSG